MGNYDPRSGDNTGSGGMLKIPNTFNSLGMFFGALPWIVRDIGKIIINNVFGGSSSNGMNPNPPSGPSVIPGGGYTGSGYGSGYYTGQSSFGDFLGGVVREEGTYARPQPTYRTDDPRQMKGERITPEITRQSPVPTVVDPAKITYSGGLWGSASALLIPMWDGGKGKFYIGTFDSNDFNTEVGCVYAFKQEPIILGRQVTVSRVRIIYRNLGPALISVSVVTAQGTALVAMSIGSKDDIGKVVTDYADLIVTGERPQLTILREPNCGPVSIIEAAMIIDVEIAEQV